jgi:queuine tRNA-ribosyltransferase
MQDTERPLLFGVVQGGLDKALRKKSLEIVQSLPVDGIAVGGLSVGETREEMHAMLEFLAPYYDPARPRFLLGVGDPIDLRFAIEHGIDMLDCVLPTRNARHATVWVTGDKKVHLTNAQYIDDPQPIDPECDCTTCLTGYSRGFLRHQFNVGESLAGSLASIHNIRYLQRICEGYRDA